jgi:transcriptional regulator with XRE-family HTH domain
MKDNRRAVRLRIGRNVRKLRVLHKLSQERLAEKAGSTSKHVGRVELGKVNVTIDVLAAISAALSVDIGELFDAHTRNVYTITRGQLTRIEHALRSVQAVKVAARRRTRARQD